MQGRVYQKPVRSLWLRYTIAMIEFLFFNAAVSEKFIAELKAMSLPFTQEIEAVQGAITVQLDEDLPDEIMDKLDVLYEALSEEDQTLLMADFADDDDLDTAGIYVQLKNGAQTIAKVNPAVMNRMLEVVSMEEFNAFVETIVSAVETPDDSPVCKPAGK